MSVFIKDEASKPEYWKLEEIITTGVDKSLLMFTFGCSAVDDGTTFKGFAFVDIKGNIKHSFAQFED